MKILLLPTLACNLKCEYCFLQSKKTSGAIKELRLPREQNVGDFSSSDYIEGIEWLQMEYGEPIESVDINGGEPFLHPHIVDIISDLIKKVGSVNITSNLEMMSDEFLRISPKNICITASMHLHDGNIRNKFFEKAKWLKDHGYHFYFNFVAYPKQLHHFEKCKNLAKQFETYCHLEPYINYNTEKTQFGEFESKSDRYYFEENITMPDVVGMNMARDRGTNEIECWVAKVYLVISENGDVWPCMSMMYERRNKIANIFKREMYMKKNDAISLKCNIFCACSHNYRDGLR